MTHLLTWSMKNTMEKEKGRLDDIKNYQFYALKSDPSVGFIAVFKDIPKLPMVYLSYEDDMKNYDISLDSMHSNSGLVFKVSVYLGEKVSDLVLLIKTEGIVLYVS